jgi:uncharacterized protein (DUF433 family)
MQHPLITSDPRIMLGKPVVAGTRITVEHILDELGGGRSFDELLEAHPRLTRDGILAALAYAADALRLEVVYPFSATYPNRTRLFSGRFLFQRDCR